MGEVKGLVVGLGLKNLKKKIVKFFEFQFFLTLHDIWWF